MIMIPVNPETGPLPLPTPSLDAESDALCGMPSLAMVYSPPQSWQKLFDPDDAFAAGTLFEGLYKPFLRGREDI